MSAFLVKHVTYGKDKRDPLASLITTIKPQPYSLTNKGEYSKKYAIGCPIYVVESRRGNKKGDKTTYWLGYKYIAHKVLLSSDPMFDYKIIATDPPIGVYFSTPKQISNIPTVVWLKNCGQGIVEIKNSDHIDCFDKIFSAGSSSL